MDNSTYPEPDERDRRKRAEEAARVAARAGGHPDGSTRPMSGLVLWLARRMGIRADVLAARFSDETIRRTKYPYLATENDDGTTSFTQVGVVPGKHRLTAPVSEGSKRDAHRGGIEIRRIDG
jgi:hypothetical protein